MTYYRFMRDPEARYKGLRLAHISEYPRVGISWQVGQRANVVPDGPIRCTIDSEKGGPDMPDMFIVSVPLFSSRLRAALARASVDNIDYYDAELIDGDGNVVSADYMAANIVGKIECADLDMSDVDSRSEFPMFEFLSLVIDEKKARDTMMFRLAENPLFVLVSQIVKDAVEPLNLVGVAILPLDDPRAY